MFVKRLNKKVISTIVIVFSFVTFNLFAESYSASQLIPAEHWIYDSLYMLYNESGEALVMDTAPLSVGEIRQSLSYIDYEKLSYSGQKIYDRINEYLGEKKFTIDMKPIKVGFNIKFHPAFMFKSNEDIEWSYGTDFAQKNEGYGAANDYYNNFLTQPFLRAPLYIDFADIAIIDCQASISKNFWGMTENYNFMNIFYKPEDFEFSWPLNANASIGYVFKNGLAVNFHVARQGLQFGHTKTGSIIYNDTFQTDFYTLLRVSGKKLKYEMGITQVDNTKFLYTHQIDFTLWKWFKLGILEGTLLNEPFELRYLNPLMIMHSFASWTQYSDPWEEKYYGESHICAYMGIKFDIIPYKNIRIYGLFAQTEIQPPTELGTPEANSIPDGIGLQLGIEVQHGDKSGGMYKFVLEGIYTNPFLYIKHGAEWSMYRKSYSMTKNGTIPICSWIGTPFGPDSLGGQISAEYKYLDKWSAELSYLFMAHGENSFGLFSHKTTRDGREFYDYYPAAKYRLYKDQWTPDQIAENERFARSWALTGIIQYTNRITAHGSYKFNEHFSIEGQVIYTIIFNNNNIFNNFQHGIEAGIAGTISLF